MYLIVAVSCTGCFLGNVVDAMHFVGDGGPAAGTVAAELVAADIIGDWVVVGIVADIEMAVNQPCLRSVVIDL